jgi:hypothetical protein
MSDHITIKSKRQKNGIWGTPSNCTYIERIPLYNYYWDKLFSAILIGIGEQYPDNLFDVFHIDENGFNVLIKNIKCFRINLKDYKLVDNKIYYVGK